MDVATAELDGVSTDVVWLELCAEVDADEWCTVELDTASASREAIELLDGA